MRRILLTTWGSYGDVFPYLALAIRLKALGHSPELATCAFYREMIEAAGIDFRPMSPDVDPRDSALIARVMDPARGSEVIVRELIVPHLREAFSQLQDAARDADLIVTHPVAFAAPLVARAMKRRWLSCVLAPSSMFSLTDFPVLPPYAALLRVVRSTPWTARAFMSLARRITGPWTEHPMSPVINENPHIARPAGRVVPWQDRVIRFTQDCRPFYGSQVRAFEVTELTTTSYQERPLQEKPILKGSGRGWNKGGMHHIDPHVADDGKWIACVDGWYWEY